MQDYDDSSDDGEEVERLDDNFLVNWTRFSGEVFPDLENRITLVNEAEKKEKTGKKESKSLFAVLTKFKTSKDMALQSVNKLITDITGLQYSKPVRKPYKSDIDCKSVKNDFEEVRADILKRIQPIFDGFKKLLDIDGIQQLFPDFDTVKPSKLEFKSRKHKLSSEEEYDEFFGLCESMFNTWETEEKHKISNIKEKLASIKSLLDNIEELLKQSIPAVTKEDCLLSFMAHFIGTSLLHHREVTAVYREDKKRYLVNHQIEEKFRLDLLSNSLVLASLHQLNDVYAAALHEPLFSYEALPSLVTTFQQEDNLRQLLKNMNTLNDCILFRRLYDCVDKSRTSFAEFIKSSNTEILDSMRDKNPFLNIYFAKVMMLTNTNFKPDSSNIQIFNTTYYYKGSKGYIAEDLLDDLDTVRNIVFMSIVNDANLSICWMLVQKRKFDSLKGFYSEGPNQSCLIEDSLQLLTALPRKFDINIKLLNREPNQSDLREIKHQPLILVRILEYSDLVLHFEIFYLFNGQILSVTWVLENTAEIFRVFKTASMKNNADGDLQFTDPRDTEYFSGVFIDFLEKSRNIELFFRPKKSEEIVSRILLRKGMDFGGKDDRAGDDVIQHVFLLIMRQIFCRLEHVERTTLPTTFMFTSTNPQEFLSNIRLSNRSLVRQSRNLLQNPSTLMQVTKIDSGSAPLVSISRTWLFNNNKSEKINLNSFFAADRQIINCKRSEKKSTLLSREHYVARVGAYSDIHLSFSTGEFIPKDSGTTIAMSILKPIFLNDPAIQYLQNSTAESSDHFYFANLFFLLFGVESMRNPAMLVINMMLIDLLRNGKASIGQLFYSSGVVEFGGASHPYFNGLMPTAPIGVTARSRELNNLYHRYMPNAYIYPGDLARNANGTPKGRDEDTQLKLGLNHLINREALVMRMWCDFHHINTNNTDELARRIADDTEKLWHLPAKIK